MAKTYKVTDRVTIYNARLMFRNFSGEETQYNPKGNRNFCIFLDYSVAEKMEKDGWAIRWLDSKDPIEPPQPIISVKVSFGNFPPNIVLISEGKKSKITEDNINILDWVEIENCDVVLSPYTWTVRGQTGVKAYLRSMYITLLVDDLAKKYEYDEGADAAIGGCGQCDICDGSCGNPAQF